MIAPNEQPLAGPIAEACVSALLERTHELVKSWAKALIDEVPLARLAEIPLESLAREMPAICAGAVRALASTHELERLVAVQHWDPRRGARLENGLRAPSVEEPPGRGAALRLGVIAGARDLSTALRATELLRAVIWRAACEELRQPDPRQLADLAERLAHICAAIGCALAACREDERDNVFGPGAAGLDRPAVEAGARGRSASKPVRVVLVDELA